MAAKRVRVLPGPTQPHSSCFNDTLDNFDMLAQDPLMRSRKSEPARELVNSWCSSHAQSRFSLCQIIYLGKATSLRNASGKGCITSSMKGSGMGGPSIGRLVDASSMLSTRWRSRKNSARAGKRLQNLLPGQMQRRALPVRPPLRRGHCNIRQAKAVHPSRRPAAATVGNEENNASGGKGLTQQDHHMDIWGIRLSSTSIIPAALVAACLPGCTRFPFD